MSSTKEPQKKHKGGREVALVFTEEMLKEVEVLAGRGLTQKQIAGYFGIGLSTIENYARNNPDLKKALVRGKSKTISFVAGKLIEQIKAGSTSATIFYLKTQAGWAEPDPNNPPPPDDDEEKAPPQKLELNTKDPNEAAKVYQQIMLRGKNERNSSGK